MATGTANVLSVLSLPKAVLVASLVDVLRDEEQKERLVVQVCDAVAALADRWDRLGRTPCGGCGALLRAENYRIADCCPCNSPRGVNHGVVPVATCTCPLCDPAQTGSTRYGADHG